MFYRHNFWVHGISCNLKGDVLFIRLIEKSQVSFRLGILIWLDVSAKCCSRLHRFFITRDRPQSVNSIRSHHEGRKSLADCPSGHS